MDTLGSYVQTIVENLITFYNKHFLCYTPLTEIYSGMQLIVACLLKISKLIKRKPKQNSQLHALLPKGKG